MKPTKQADEGHGGHENSENLKKDEADEGHEGQETYENSESWKKDEADEGHENSGRVDVNKTGLKTGERRPERWTPSRHHRGKAALAFGEHLSGGRSDRAVRRSSCSGGCARSHVREPGRR